MTLQGYTQSGATFGGMVFPYVQWHSWGAGQSTAPDTHAYLVGPGDWGTVTLYAFNLGSCGGTYGYQALEWVRSGATVDAASYYDTCTGKGVGRGYRVTPNSGPIRTVP